MRCPRCWLPENMTTSSSSDCLGVVLFVVRRSADTHHYLLVAVPVAASPASGGPWQGRVVRTSCRIERRCASFVKKPVSFPTALYETELQAPHLEERGFLSIFVAFVEAFAEVVLNYEHDAFRWLSANGLKSAHPPRPTGPSTRSKSWYSAFRSRVRVGSGPTPRRERQRKRRR